MTRVRALRRSLPCATSVVPWLRRNSGDTASPFLLYVCANEMSTDWPLQCTDGLLLIASLYCKLSFCITLINATQFSAHFHSITCMRYCGNLNVSTYCLAVFAEYGWQPQLSVDILSCGVVDSVMRGTMSFICLLDFTWSHICNCLSHNMDGC